MYRDVKVIEVKFIVDYEYDSDLEKIKAIIKEITDLKNLIELSVKEDK